MMLPRMHDSPMPMKTMSGLDSDTATAPTDELLIWPSVTGAQVSPASVVFHSPPPTAPKYPSFGRPLTPVTAIDRPPRSGPMLRHCSALSTTGSTLDEPPDCARSAAVRSGSEGANTVANAASAAKIRRRMVRCMPRSLSLFLLRIQRDRDVIGRVQVLLRRGLD